MYGHRFFPLYPPIYLSYWIPRSDWAVSLAGKMVAGISRKLASRGMAVENGSGESVSPVETAP